MLDRVAALTGARRARIVERVQTLWRGYGEILRVALDGGVAPTVIVKHVEPPTTRDSVSDARKRRSYDNEARFYRELAPRCDDSCRVAKLYGLDGEWLFVLEDLDAAGFRDRHDDARGADLDACLHWLASFHARFFEVEWSPGTYWHLGTRREELAAIRGSLRDHAEAYDARLAGARYQTILHGDPKEANFCFGRDGVAAVDFQYAGRGCGMRDVAYLLHGRTNITRQLDTYFRYLARPDVEAEWRELYDVARLDFERFLAGWRPSGVPTT